MNKEDKREEWYQYYISPILITLVGITILLCMCYLFKTAVVKPAKTKEAKTMIYDYGKRQDTVKITTIYEEQ